MTEEQILSRSTFNAVSGIILSTTIMGMASGLLFAYIPLKLLGLGFEPWVAASMMPAIAFGGLIGCLVTGPLLRLSGHARVFMLLYAMVITSIMLISLTTNPLSWLFARAIYGFAMNGVFIVALSWLHNAATDAIRGRIVTAFYVAYVIAIGAGSFLIGFVDVAGNAAPLVAALCVAIAIMPVALTRLPQPEPPEAMAINPKKVWQISPVGLIGMLTVGGVTMTLQTFAPIYASELSYSTADVGLMMALMQIGIMFIQVPLGTMSDLMDRRYVILATCVGATIVSIFAFGSAGSIGFILLIIVFALWNGFNETLYSLSSALANDRADPKHYVMLSSTLMIAWSVAAFIVPTIAVLCAQFLPLSFFMPLCAVLTLSFGVFVIYRIMQSNEIPAEERDSFQPVTGQIAYPGDYSNPDAWDEVDQVNIDKPAI